MKKIYALYPGRFQPLHLGHKLHIRSLLGEGKNVCVLIRDTEIDPDKNPYTVEQRIAMVAKAFPKEFGESVIALGVPDFSEIVYGRSVGYKLREVRLDSKTENISATKIRNSMADGAKRSG